MPLITGLMWEQLILQMTTRQGCIFILKARQGRRYHYIGHRPWQTEVTIDWGDGSNPNTYAGTGDLNITHAYSSSGNYVISLDPASGCILGLGNGSVSTCVIGGDNIGYRGMLIRAEIGHRIQSINSYAFGNCYALSSIVIAKGITSIGEHAFISCINLSHCTFPSGTVSLYTFIFDSCSTLRTVSLPNSITLLGANYGACGVFTQCRSLISLCIPSGTTVIAGDLCRHCTSLKRVILLGNVTRELGAFYYCYSLTSLTYPQSVTEIGDTTFYDDYLMKDFHFKSTTPPTLGGPNAFTNIPSDCIIYVPMASVDAYKAASYWSTHASKIVGE